MTRSSPCFETFIFLLRTLIFAREIVIERCRLNRIKYEYTVRSINFQQPSQFFTRIVNNIAFSSQFWRSKNFPFFQFIKNYIYFLKSLQVKCTQILINKIWNQIIQFNFQSKNTVTTENVTSLDFWYWVFSQHPTFKLKHFRRDQNDASIYLCFTNVNSLRRLLASCSNIK